MRREAFIAACQRMGAQLLDAPGLSEVGYDGVPDLSGNAYDGALKNGVSLSATGLIEGAAAALLNGKDGYIDTSWKTRMNFVVNPCLLSAGTPSTSKWSPRSTCTITAAEGQGKDGTNALLMVRKTDGGGNDSMYAHTDPGVASNGANAPDLSAYVGKYAVAIAEVRNRDATRNCSLAHIFSNAAGALIESPSGGSAVPAVSADPNKTTRIWFAKKIPAGCVTDDVRFQCTLAGEGEGVYFSKPMLVIMDEEPKSAADLPTYFPDATQLASGEAGWSGTTDASISDIGPFARGTARTFVGMASRASGSAYDALFGDASGTPFAYLESGTQNLRFQPGGGEDKVLGTWPGDSIPTMYAIVFDDAANTAQVFINGVASAAVTFSQPFSAPDGVSLLIGSEGSPGADAFGGSLLPFAVFTRALSLEEIDLLASIAGLGVQPICPPLPPQITVVSVARGGEGRGYNLTDEAEGLSYSNVNPGGDEMCAFTLHREWFAANPEIDRGNLLRVMCGIDVTWQGRVEETDRSASDAETIAVTAYGGGVRLKDGVFQEIFIDSDLSRWDDISTQRKIDIIKAGWNPNAFPASIGGRDQGDAGPAIIFTTSDFSAGSTEANELYYYAGGIDIGSFRFDFVATPSALVAEFQDLQFFSTDDLASSIDLGVDYNHVTALNQKIVAAGSGRKYVALRLLYENAAFVGQYVSTSAYQNPKVLGRHGLTEQGTWPKIGFTVDQIVNYLISLVAGIVQRRVDAQSFVVEQAAYIEPTSHEDGIRDVNRYENADWGTWGPSSPLDNSTNGYFDFTTPDPSAQQWFIPRRDCDSMDLHSETSSLFGKVHVVYTDEADIQRILTVEADVPDLDAAGFTREYTLPIGTATEEIARARGEAFLNIWGQFAPARGSFTVSLPVRHYRRGEISPAFFRADGSNARLPDILPASTLFALDATPDRRTTFPIKRVQVDCSGVVPVANVEVDQTDDSLSVLQARSDLSTSLIPS